MKNFLLFLNIFLSLAIIFFILIQGRGAGLGSAWGGGGEMFQTRRGLDKLIMWLTIFVVIGFLIVSFINLFVS